MRKLQNFTTFNSHSGLLRGGGKTQEPAPDAASGLQIQVGSKWSKSRSDKGSAVEQKKVVCCSLISLKICNFTSHCIFQPKVQEDGEQAAEGGERGHRRRRNRRPTAPRATCPSSRPPPSATGTDGILLGFWPMFCMEAISKCATKFIIHIPT